MSSQDHLLNIVFPISESNVNDKEVELKILGLVEQLQIGFKLNLKRNLKPVFLHTEDGLSPNSNAVWVDEGVVFYSSGESTNLFIEFLSILIGKKAKLQAKEEVPFSALLLMGDMQNFSLTKPFKDEHEEIELLPRPPSFETESIERLPYLFKFKLEFTDRNFSEFPIQFILSLDLQERKLILSEKNMLTREYLLKVFALKDLVNGSSLEVH